MHRRVPVVAAFSALGMWLTAEAFGEAADAAPLRPGEAVIRASNCAMVVAGKTPEQLAESAQVFAPLRWTGDCRNGLAHGRGSFAKGDADAEPNVVQAYHLGRALHVRLDVGRTVYADALGPEGRTASIADNDAQVPVWSREITEGQVMAEGTRVMAEDVTVLALTAKCTIDPTLFRRCRAPHYPVYGIMVTKRPPPAASHAGSTQTPFALSWRFVWCPDPRSPTNCEEVWRATAGPTIAKAIEIRNAALAADRVLVAEIDALAASEAAASSPPLRR